MAGGAIPPRKPTAFEDLQTGDQVRGTVIEVQRDVLLVTPWSCNRGRAQLTGWQVFVPGTRRAGNPALQQSIGSAVGSRAAAGYGAGKGGPFLSTVDC